jgi:hypothetical protein
MNFQEILDQLNDLPATFRREGPPYTQLVESLAAGLYLFCQALDAVQAQLNYGTASGGWLDIWGDLAGIPRNTGEPDIEYQPRIQATVLAWRDSVVAIEAFINNVENTLATVAEVPPIGYTIFFSTTDDLNIITKILYDLRYIRPVGVPFNIRSQIGLFLNTVNYYGQIAPTIIPIEGRVTGDYLAGTTPVQLLLSASVNSAQSLIPSLLFEDPTINPGL